MCLGHVQPTGLTRQADTELAPSMVKYQLHVQRVDNVLQMAPAGLRCYNQIYSTLNSKTE